MQCEGMRRFGGAFSLGPVQWKQCENEATVMLTVKQKGEKVGEFPACPTCWQECLGTEGMTVKKARPLNG